MTVELTPRGIQCNLSCPYCYQHPMRDGGNFGGKYDMDAMKRGLDVEGITPVTLFGGEPLLMKIEDIDEIYRWNTERHQKAGRSISGINNIQTNGVLMTDAHIEIFKKWNVGVGMSIDGPDDLNVSRWAGSAAKTEEATRKSMYNIVALAHNHRPPSIIVTLYSVNIAKENRQAMMDWFKKLDRIGVSAIRLHTLEIDNASVEASMAPTMLEYIDFFYDMILFEKELTRVRFDIFADIERLLLGDDRNVTCTWNACDTLTTPAVRGVDGDGTRRNCGRTNKEGVPMRKADDAGFERYIALYNTPHENGGCKGCQYFFACKGQCPGTAIDGDFRNRSSHCELFIALFKVGESRLITHGQDPITTKPEVVKMVEQRLLESWSRGRYLSIYDAVNMKEGQSSDGHGDVPHGDYHGDSDHGDAPHGDHTDDALLGIAPIGRPENA